MEKQQQHNEEFDIAIMEEQSLEMMEVRKINKDNAIIQKTKGGFISMEYEGVQYSRVNVFRTFPFTDPDRYISVREANDKAREIGIIIDLWADLREDDAISVKEQLEIRYFTPKIERIKELKDEYGFAYFTVQTDMGDCKFTMNMNSGAVVHLSETRIIITDLDGNRYEIADLNRLTALELKKLDVLL